jgi:hypothetical protein
MFLSTNSSSDSAALGILNNPHDENDDYWTTMEDHSWTKVTPRSTHRSAACMPKEKKHPPQNDAMSVIMKFMNIDDVDQRKAFAHEQALLLRKYKYDVDYPAMEKPQVTPTKTTIVTNNHKTKMWSEQKRIHKDIVFNRLQAKSKIPIDGVETVDPMSVGTFVMSKIMSTIIANTY